MGRARRKASGARAAGLRPLEPAPVLVVRSGRRRPWVVIADLHLGLAATPANPLGPPGSSAPEIADELVRLCGRAGAGRLIVAGDAKHPIVGAPAWLRPVIFDVFATLLDRGVVPEVVLGNHDVGLARCLPKEVVVHPSEGVVVDGVGIFHGHRWPSPAVLSARALVAGHLHPGFRFAPTADAPDGKRRVWLRVDFRDGPGVARPDGAPAAARELIVLPAFHPLAGTEALNRDRPLRGRSFLYGRFLTRGTARAYLLDGTDLGVLPTDGVRPADATARRAPAAR
jgi:uncharacterized protein